MTGVIRNDGQAAVSGARFSTTLPGELSLVPGTLSPWATYTPGARQIAWEGALDRDQQVQIDLSVQVDDPLPDGTAIHLPAVFGYDEHALSFEWPLILRVNAPDLSTSTLNVEPAMAPPSSTLTYTLQIRNTGVRGATAIVTASAPYHSYFTGTLDSQGVGTGEILSQNLAWQGTVPAGDQVRLRYHMTSGDADGDWLVHQAHVRDQFDEHWPVGTLAYVWLRKAYLPIVYRPSTR
jgi:hypothetical protein